MYVSTFPTSPQIESRDAHRHQEHLLAVDRPAIETRVDAPVTVRLLEDSDSGRLERLAGRDSSATPAGRVLGAEVDGALIATISLDDGAILADPFHSTGDALELLRLRARQVNTPSGPSRLRRVLDALGRGNAHAGLAGSPPGAGGRLLQL